MQTVFNTLSLFRYNTIEMPQRREKRELTDLEKADCKTGKMIGGIALKGPAGGAESAAALSSKTEPAPTM